MKVRHPLLPGRELRAKLVAAPSMLARGETTPTLELDAGAPMQVPPPGTDCELVEASDEERAMLREAGYRLRDATGVKVAAQGRGSQLYGWAVFLFVLFLVAITLYARS